MSGNISKQVEVPKTATISPTNKACKEKKQKKAGLENSLAPPSRANEVSLTALNTLPANQPIPKVTRIPLLFPASAFCSISAYKSTILRFTNLPWTLTTDQLIGWLSNGIEKHLPEPAHQIVSVHICCDRLARPYFCFSMIKPNLGLQLQWSYPGTSLRRTYI